MREFGRGIHGLDDENEDPLFQWLHIRSGERVGIIFSDQQPLWYYGHWMKGRMWPCDGPDCELCPMGVGKQRRWVFAIGVPTTMKTYLWEVSETIAGEIRGIMERFDSMLNVRVIVRREEGSNRGRLILSDPVYDPAQRASSMKFPDIGIGVQLTWQAMDRARFVTPEEQLRREGKLIDEHFGYAERGREY